MNIRKIVLAGTTAILGGWSPALAEGVLNILNYPDYLPPVLSEKFEKDTGIKLVLTPIDSNETLLAKLQTGTAGYDAAVATDYMVDILRKENLIEEAAIKDLPHYSNLLPLFHGAYYDPENNFALPYQYGSTSLMVDSAVLPDAPRSLSLIFDPPEGAVGRINVHRDMHDVINAALRYLDYPRCNSNPEQLRAVNELLTKIKPSIRSVNSAGTVDLLASGDVVVSQIWSGAGLRARRERATLEYIYTEEGYTGWVDSLVMVRGSENSENVRIFMDWLLLPENSAILTNHAGYGSPVSGAAEFLSDELRNSPETNPPEGSPAPEFVPNCAPDVIALYDRIWTNFLK